MAKYYLCKWGKRIGFTVSNKVAESAKEIGYLVITGNKNG